MKLLNYIIVFIKKYRSELSFFAIIGVLWVFFFFVIITLVLNSWELSLKF